MQGSFSTMTWDLRFGLSEDGILSAEDSARVFSTKQDTTHRMLLFYTTGSIDRNQLLYAIAAYNFANFRVKGFDLSFEEVGSLTIFTISGFNNFREIIDYYDMIYGEGGYASALDGIVTFFPFSDENYDVLMHGKTLEEYMLFFVENYGEEAPGLVDRWRVRVDADRLAVEAENAAMQAEALEKEAKEKETKDIKQPEKVKEEPVIIEENKTDSLIITKEAVIDSIPDTSTKKGDISEKEIDLFEDEEDYDRPKAKGGNIFQKLFKRVKESNEFKALQDGLNTAKELAGEDDLTDTVIDEKPLERVGGELTFEQLQEIRKREAEEQAVLNAEVTLSKEESKKAADELKKQQAKEREQLLTEKKKAEKERLKQREKERKQKEKDNNQKLKQREKDQKAKAKERNAALKNKAAQSKKK